MGATQPDDKRKRIIPLALFILLIIGGVVFFSMRSPEQDVTKFPTRLWFIDIQTNRLFADAADQIPPFKNAAGHECVLATVLSCGADCSGKDLNGKTPEEVASLGLRVGYLQRLTPPAKQAVEDFKKTNPLPEHVMVQCMQKLVFEGEYREIGNDKWMPMRSQDFVKMTGELDNRCHNPQQCKPPG